MAVPVEAVEKYLRLRRQGDGLHAAYLAACDDAGPALAELARADAVVQRWVPGVHLTVSEKGEVFHDEPQFSSEIKRLGNAYFQEELPPRRLFVKLDAGQASTVQAYLSLE